MSALKIVLPVILAGAVSLSWFQLVSSVVSEQNSYRQCIQKAKESEQNGLYEQAIEYYKKSLNYKEDTKVYAEISRICSEFYAEEDTSHVRKVYIDNMLEAAEAVPEEPSYWITAIKLYMDRKDYSSAYSTVKKARNRSEANEEIESLYQELRYMTLTDSSRFSDFKTALNGYISIYDGESWKVTNSVGKVLSSGKYQMIGLLDESGTGIYIGDMGMRMLDKHEIVRARFDFTVDDAGIYSAETDCLPVLRNGNWQYVGLDGSYLSGRYDEAGRFANGRAAVKEDGVWYLINQNEEKISSDYEDIKLDLSGSYLQNGVFIAKTDGKYRIYNASGQQAGSLVCEDIDICLKDKLIAYEDGGLWGFADTEGNTVIEPQYQKAKSFSNGLAAVCDGKEWGFIDPENNLVVDYQFLDAFYFNAKHYCIVSCEENSYQFMHLMFD